MRKYIKEALDQGYIWPSTSPAAASFFFVSKKDGGLRPCIDYRALNQVTVKFSYPLPLIPAALEQLREAKMFSKLDLRSAYNLIRIREGDEWKTAFITPAGHYEYLVMPYGLVNAPSVFQSFMDEVLRDFLGKFVLVYIDDILIYSKNPAGHQRHVSLVLQRLREFTLFLKAEKCTFHQTTVDFLGYVLSDRGVEMDRSKTETIMSWPTPKSVKELQRFLGFANFYRRFINQYSLLTAPLTTLLKEKPKILKLTPEAEEAFTFLKSAFTTAPLLHHPDPERPFVVEVDASTTGVGGVLSQYSDCSSKPSPCAFFLKKFSPAEANYDIGNRELLAVKLALEEWRHWLEGEKHPFLVLTYHKNLQYLRDAKRLNPRQARWALFFTRFHFKIAYRPGSKNTRADALSRFHASEIPVEEPETILPESLFVNPIQWEINDQLQELSQQQPRVPGCPPGKIYVPEEFRTSLIISSHWTPRGKQDSSHSTSQILVVHHAIRHHQLHSRIPWSHIGVDFVTDLSVSEGNTCIFVAIDRFSKACKLIPLKGLPTAFNTAELLVEHVFRNFCIPEDIVSDRGPQFISRVWRAFFTLMNVTVSLSSGYHPQTNGQTERKIQDIGRFLRAFCHSNQNIWSKYLIWAEYAQNSLRQTSTQLTPFQCVLGCQPPLFPWSGEPSEVPAVNKWFEESEQVWDQTHHHIQQAVNRQQQFADKHRRPNPEYQPEQLVWLSTRDIRLRQSCRKLNPKYIGPFPVVKRINPVTYQLQLPPEYRIHPTFHVSLLKPYHPPVPQSVTEVEPEDNPPIPPIEPESIYLIKEILDSRRRGGKLEYLIDWEGYGPEERSWVPHNDVLDPSLLLEFHAQHPEKSAPRPRGRPPRRRGPRSAGADSGGGGNVRSQSEFSQVTTQRSLSPEF
ncbi:retrotransposable element [Pimephales promelas]|nr:retrotransposable element [Pimephales promelas]